ncbi:LTA synthase family protein [uncultured Thiothrix sp.]|uniref:LTA synthase family protein n=1 Tax=uncultured Thiothrix sp. TaxID=223185 RepID=UPI00263659E0|nr:alkaline phosphatase family protein [uncultured Thiothrix sp.]
MTLNSNTEKAFLPPRYRTLFWVLLLFLLINFLTRIGLMLFEGDANNFAFNIFPKILFSGFIYDLSAATYVLIPFIVLALLFGDGPRRRWLFAVSATALLAIAVFGFLFTALAEGTFWNEFSSRFNFIAVDYLIYTREVMGNIWQSYPVTWLLLGLALIALGLLWLVRKPFWRAALAETGNLPKRLVISLLLLSLPVASFLLVNDHLRDGFTRPAERELASNGYYEFMRAFRTNDLDYFKFYKTLPTAQANQVLQQAFQKGQPALNFIPNSMPATHAVQPDAAPLEKNVVLISIESLGADFVESFGGKAGLTPNLDRFAQQGIVFNQLYATGLRTVRGLEALTLSIPPTPGHAVPARKHNTGLQTLGGVLKQNGYVPFYIYGGYSYFDNMENFFTGNGYQVVDRTDVAAADIHHETIWGIADEDILHHAIGVINQQVAKGQKVFAHIMTTSNHRPFTYPEGRIDIASGSGRDGAVKYTDWAIGKFMEEASQQPWFKDTLFVFVADHTSHGRGRTDLPPENYRIPMIIYAPAFIQPQKIDALASQIDVAPTILGLLNIPYVSEFYGQDIRLAAAHNPRAFMANYLTVGYLKNGKVIELMPKQSTQVIDAQTGAELPADPAATDEAIAYYQTAAARLNALQTTK